MKFSVFFLFLKLNFVFGVLSPAHAMLSDGLHGHQSYVDFAKKEEAFKAACYVQDGIHHIMQSGVLIAPDIVMTAAHGIVKSIENQPLNPNDPRSIKVSGLIVGFGDRVSKNPKDQYEVSSIIIHPNYGVGPDGERAKYDIAFLKLTNPVKGIEPTTFFQEKELPSELPLTVVTFGSADIAPGLPIDKRAFVLPESDRFYSSSQDTQTFHTEKNVLMGSIFFQPSDFPSEINPLQSNERDIRTAKAQKHWVAQGKHPYALSLPGSSGAPVFVDIVENGRKRIYVLGIISSFSSLSMTSFIYPDGDHEVDLILRGGPRQAYGTYQSVFCLPYQLLDPIQSTKLTKTYRLDPDIKKMLDILSSN